MNPPFSWPGGSMIVDYDGRILAQADPGPGSKTVVAPIDIAALRDARETRLGHHMAAHLRSEAYPVYRRSFWPPARAQAGRDLDMQTTVATIAEVKKRLA